MKNNDTPVDGSKAIYLSQLSDGMSYLGIHGADEARIAFCLNCIFFDEVIINAASLIGNDYLYSFMVKENTVMSSFYKDGIIKPLLRFSNKSEMPDNLPDICERMIKGNTLTSIENNESLSRHANLIQKKLPSFAWVDHDQYWEKYNNTLHGLLHFSNIDNKELSTEYVYKYFDNKIKEGQFPFENISQFYEFLDQSSFVDKHQSLFIKKCAEFSAQYTNSNLLSSRISIHDSLSVFLNLLKNNNKSDSHFDLEENKKFSIPFNIGGLSNFNLTEISIVRNLPNFVNLRNELSNFRSGKFIDDEYLQSIIEECVVDLQKIANSESFIRKEIIETVIKREKDKQASMILKHSEIGVISLAFFEYFTGASVPISLMLSPIGLAISRKIKHKSSSFSEANFIPNVEYNSTEGIYRKIHSS